jgi:hypothetical protein
MALIFYLKNLTPIGLSDAQVGVTAFQLHKYSCAARSPKSVFEFDLAIYSNVK